MVGFVKKRQLLEKDNQRETTDDESDRAARAESAQHTGTKGVLLLKTTTMIYPLGNALSARAARSRSLSFVSLLSSRSSSLPSGGITR